MRRNPLLYSDHGEVEEPEIFEEPKRKRSWLFYFIILTNLLLVFFVLGIIWVLFLKSPSLHIKELTERFFGTTTYQVETKLSTTSTPTIKINADTTKTLTEQDNDEAQQALLKQMRKQEELATEQLTSEKTHIKPESNHQEIESIVQPTSLDTTRNTEQISEGTSSPPPKAVIQETVKPNEAAIVPNASSESSISQPSINTQFDQIIKTMEQDKKEKEAAKQAQSNLSTPNTNDDRSVNSKKEINPELMERQLEKLIADKLENRQRD